MEGVKRFLLEERASSEGVSSIFLISMAAVLLGAGLIVYWGAFNGFFNSLNTWLQGAGEELSSWN
jgi:ABC-type lipoprotein release transport system permease subunit